MSELDWDGHPNKAYLALRTVLHALRDRLTVEEAVDLGAQLPMLIRGLYYEGWTLKGKPHKERTKADFLIHVKKTFENDYTSRPESITRARPWRAIPAKARSRTSRTCCRSRCMSCGRRDNYARWAFPREPVQLATRRAWFIDDN